MATSSGDAGNAVTRMLPRPTPNRGLSVRFSDLGEML